MATGKHYFVEVNDDGKYAVRARGSLRASRLFAKQKEAEAYAKTMSEGGKPNVERVRKTKAGKPPQWRKA